MKRRKRRSSKKKSQNKINKKIGAEKEVDKN
jgi:hypothetical protein